LDRNCLILNREALFEIDMRQLTSQEREALMADMKSFFDHDKAYESLNNDETLGTEDSDLGHGWSGDMPGTR
jgi:hypothetical protein